MELIAKRKVGQTWHAALEGRGAGRSSALLACFEALRESGMAEAEAAYRALAEFSLLWPMTEPTEASPDGAGGQAATEDGTAPSAGATAADRTD